MKQVLNQFDKLNGAKFIKFNGYTSKGTGEISNILLNVNISEINMKKNDFEKLKSLGEDQLKQVAESKGIALNIVQVALNELLVSAEKNLSENLEDRTVQSQAQTNAYYHITKGIKLNKETRQLYVTGLELRKEVIVKGEYKTVNSSAKTIAKNELKKVAQLSSNKYRCFVFDNIDQLKINGRFFELK